MRRRILSVALSAVALAVALLGVPLGFAIHRNAVNEERGELERAALRASATVSPSFRSGDPVELPTAQARIRTGLYDVTGRRVTGTGPDHLEAALAAALGGQVVDATTDQDMVEAVPVSVDEQVIGVVRASSTRASVRATVLRDLAALAAVILIALVGAAALAFWQARRLTKAMQDLAGEATRLGAGDFSVRPATSGVAEIDLTADALATTARRLEDQIARERAFAAQASHQLRTPLTRLQLELEAGLAGPGSLEISVQAALGTADLLSRTIDDVLALAREPRDAADRFDVDELLAECIEEWRGTFATDDRPLRLVAEEPVAANASRTAVRQVLQVLIDNAYRHGRGIVTLTARETGNAVAIDVTDQGDGVVTWPSGDNGGLGLTMARSLVDSQGGRLLLGSDARGTRITLLLPGAAES